MDLFRNVKTGIGLLAAIVGAVVMIFQESINSELLKTANDLALPLGFAFFVIGLVLAVWGYQEIAKAEINAETKGAKARYDAEKDKGPIIRGKGSKKTKAEITGNQGLIDADESEESEFKINSSEKKSGDNEKKKLKLKAQVLKIVLLKSLKTNI
jgi:hypothetical protein